MLQSFALSAPPALLLRLLQPHPYLDHLRLPCELGPHLLLAHQRVLAREVAGQGLALRLQEYLGLAVGNHLAPLLLPVDDGKQAGSLPLFQHAKVDVEVVRLAELERLSALELPLRQGLDGEFQFLFAGVLLREYGVIAGFLLLELELL